MIKVLKKRRYVFFALSIYLAAALALSACGSSLGGGSDAGTEAGTTRDGNAGAAGTTSNATAATTSAAAALPFGGELSGTLTVSAFDPMTYRSILESAAEEFKEKHPDVDITVDTFSAMPEIQRQESADGRTSMMVARVEQNPQDRTDYANKINTALMSGEGADILAVDVIPVAKYVESGLLENLAPYMDQDPDFNVADYRKNILDAVTWKGGTWFLPMDYGFNYYTYDSTLITEGTDKFGTSSSYTTEELVSMAAPMFDGETMLLNTPVYTKGPGGSTWSRLLRERWSDFVDIANKKAHFNDGAFVELLNLALSYGEDGYIPQTVTGMMDREDMMSRMRQEPTDRYYFKPKSNSQLLQYYMRDSMLQFNVSYGGANAAIEADDEIAGIAANDDNSVPFTYSRAYAINSNSKNKQAAWEFIKFLMSGESQATGFGGPNAGMPIHNETRATQIETMLASMSAGIRGNAAFGSTANFGRMQANDNPGGGGNTPGGGGNTPGGGGNTPGGGGAAPADGGSAPAVRGAAPADGDAAPAGGGATPAGGGAAPAGGGNAGAPGTVKEAGDDQGDVAGGKLGDTGADRTGTFTFGNPQQGAPGNRMPEGPITEIDPEVLARYYKAIEEFSDQINTFEIKDTIIDDMIQAEIDYFFEGVKTAEEVASTLQSKVELYLNE